METRSPSSPAPARGAAPKTLATFDRSYAIRVMAILAGLVTIVMYIEGMLTPSLPSIAGDFSVGVSQVSLVLSVYLVTGVALSPIAGKLADIYGKKKVLTIVLILYAIAVSVTGFSPTFSFMVASRAVQGVGLTVFPLAMSLVREEFPREMVPRAQGLLSALFGVGFAISLPLGSFVSQSYGWRFTYHSAIPFVVAITIGCMLLLRESPYRRPNAYIDFAGASVLAVSLALIVLGLSQGPAWGWSSPAVLAMLLGGSVLLVPVALIELYLHRRQREVILDVRLLSQRNVLVANLVLTISGLGMFLAFQALTFRLEYPHPVGFDQTIFETGVSFVAFAAAMLVVAPLASFVVTRVGTKPLTVLGCLVGAAGFFLASRSTELPQLLGVMFVIGAGIALINAAVINLLVLTVDPHDMGLATSMNAVFRNVGSSIGAPIAGSLMATFTVAVPVAVVGGQTIFSTFPSDTAFNDAYYIAAVAFVIAAGITLLAREILGRRADLAALAADERPSEIPAAAS